MALMAKPPMSRRPGRLCSSQRRTSSVRDSDAPYRWHVDIAPLERIANHEKTMPANFIRKDGHGITAAARRYLQPLIEGEAFPPFGRNGLPDYVRLDQSVLRRKLPRWEA